MLITNKPPLRLNNQKDASGTRQLLFCTFAKWVTPSLVCPLPSLSVCKAAQSRDSLTPHVQLPQMRDSHFLVAYQLLS